MKSRFTSLRTFLQSGMVPLTVAGGLLLTGVFTDQIFATPIPQNLGNGLRDIVEKQLSASQAAPNAQAAPNTANAAQHPALINYDKLKITDAQKRILVNIVLNGTVRTRPSKAA